MATQMLILTNSFFMKDTELYVPVVILSSKDNKKLSKCLTKRLERSVY